MNVVRIIAILTCPLLVCGLFLYQTVATNNLANDGVILKDITEKATYIAMENEQLEQRIASLSSLLQIRKQAEIQGFVEAKHVLTLSQDEKRLVALTQKR